MGYNFNFKNFGDAPPGEGNGGKAAGNFTLAQQSSVYSLTFDEFQNTIGGLGKDFGSMNMDELLKNIWTAEETQGVTSTSEMSSTGAEVEYFEDHSPISSEVDASSENLQIPSSEDVITPEEVELTVDETESQVSTVTFLGIASLVYGSTAFIYGNKRKSTASNPAISVVQPSLTKKLDASPTVPFSI